MLQLRYCNIASEFVAFFEKKLKVSYPRDIIRRTKRE